MKTLSLLVLAAVTALSPLSGRAACSSCGAAGNASSDVQPGPAFNISMGKASYGEFVGDLTFAESVPDPLIYTPVDLQFNSSRPDVAIITAPFVTTNYLGTDIETNYTLFMTTNVWPFSTNLGIVTYATNIDYEWSNIVVTNVDLDIETHTILHQVYAPQVLADIPTPTNQNGYIINLYYSSQVTGLVSGLYQFTGSPFMIWTITNTSPPGTNQFQVTQSDPSDGILKQWSYTYDPSSGIWTMQPLGGTIAETMVTSNLTSTTYQIVNAWKSPSGPVVKQIATTYQIFSWGPAPIQKVVGVGASAQTNTYTYTTPSAGQYPPLYNTVTHPDGSWEFYDGYDANGNPTAVYSSFGDLSSSSPWGAKVSTLNYGSSYGDDGTISSNIARETIESVNGSETARRFTLFPDLGTRLDIQSPNPGVLWNAAGNLITTNLFYTNGPNQFLSKAVIRPDGTMTTYDYVTNSAGTYRTNITATGQPNSSFTSIVDGTTNYTVVNQFGYLVASVSRDIVSGDLLVQDTYGDFDGYSRPQVVTHLDGTTEATVYSACCGLSYGTNRDSLTTQYIYDAAKRQVGYSLNEIGLTYTNILDAAGNVVASVRLGSGSTVTTSSAAYDLGGLMTYQTNALGGVTSYVETHDATTGGRIQIVTYPDGGTRTSAYYLDGTLKKVTGTAAFPAACGNILDYDSTLGINAIYAAKTNLDNTGAATSEWSKSYADMLGRTYKTVYAAASGTPTAYSYYNAQGQFSQQVDPDGVTTLYTYNAKGEPAYTAVDLNGNGTIDLTGPDRITRVTNDVVAASAVWRTRTYVYTDSSGTEFLSATRETSLDGLRTTNTIWNGSTPVIRRTVTAYGGSGARTVTTTAPDNSYSISVYSYGRLTSTTRYDSIGAQIGATTYAYDTQGRQQTITDARNGTTTYGYNDADQVTSMTTPAPGPGQAPETTITSFDNMLRPTGQTLPDGTSTTSLYYPNGLLAKAYGSHMYPVGYSYDYAGRMTTMTNWSGFASSAGARVTTWSYDMYRGFLSGKTYDGSVAGPAYTNSSAGRLIGRAWARGVGTSYAYTSAGDLKSVAYSDSTAGVNYGYDRRGRQVAITNGATICSMSYDDVNDLLTESYTGGPLNGMAVTNNYDSLARRIAVAINSQPSTLNQFSYDNASRLQTVTSGNDTATYSYLANSPLVNQITYKQSGTTRMTTIKQFDFLNRLTSISSTTNSGGAAETFDYTYNSANQRTADNLSDGSYWRYNYDTLGQVISGKKYWSDGTPVAGQQFEYGFDDIGNRTQTKAGGDEGGGNLRTASYTANTLNQYTQRDVPGTNDVIGIAIATNNVTVNAVAPYRKGEYYRGLAGSNNVATAVWQPVTNTCGTSNIIGNIFIPKTPEAFTYDADGNLTSDGRWTNHWDGENRLIAMESLPSPPAGSKLSLQFGYDWKSRRISKVVSNYVGSAWSLVSSNRFIYDGWNLLAILDPSSSILSSYTWGNDLSGSLQGAGGVGGLLQASIGTTNCFAACDGNGNVVALVNAADGTVIANYDYGPFGEVIRATGPMAKANPIRWSSKYQDDESDLVMYPLRPYGPSTGRWLSRDPIGERGGVNLYAMVGNNPVEYIDPDGLQFYGPVIPPPDPNAPTVDPNDPTAKWAPADCPNGQKTAFIQVFVGYVFSPGPHVDNGSFGPNSSSSTGNPLYPVPSGVTFFGDSPTALWLTPHAQFMVCRVCLSPCTCMFKKRPHESGAAGLPGYKIVSIGPCALWTMGTQMGGNDLAQTAAISDGPNQNWQVAMDKEFPDAAKGKCFR